MRRWSARWKRWAGALVAACLVSLGVAAGAEGPDDRATTDALLREAEGSKKKDVALEMIARSRAALERAARLRASGDEPHARLADGLARTWAEAARDVIRAVEVEERAQAARRGATDAGAMAERERALLEEGIAQTGRLEAQLDAAERESKEQPARTSAAAGAETDAGAKKGQPQPPAPKQTRDAPKPAPRDATKDMKDVKGARDGGAR